MWEVPAVAKDRGVTETSGTTCPTMRMYIRDLSQCRVHSAQYTPVSRHTRYSVLACCTGFTSFSEPSSSSSPGHTKNCIRFLVCADKVYCNTCASNEPMQSTPFSYPHSLNPYLTLPVILNNYPGMVVCVEKFSGNSVLDSMSLSLFCTLAVMSLHGSGGWINFSLLLWIANSINRLQLVGWFLHVVNETGYIANISKYIRMSWNVSYHKNFCYCFQQKCWQYVCLCVASTPRHFHRSVEKCTCWKTQLIQVFTFGPTQWPYSLSSTNQCMQQWSVVSSTSPRSFCQFHF